jgi:hypothetical protein
MSRGYYKTGNEQTILDDHDLLKAVYQTVTSGSEESRTGGSVSAGLSLSASQR